MAQRSADTKAARVARFQGFVDQSRRLLHHAEGPGAESLGHVFGGRPDERNFEIVDHSGAVEDEAAQPATLHHIDEDGAEAALDDVGAHGQDVGPPTLACGCEAIDDVDDVQGPSAEAGTARASRRWLATSAGRQNRQRALVLPVVHRDGAHLSQGLQVFRRRANGLAGHIGTAPTHDLRLRSRAIIAIR